MDTRAARREVGAGPGRIAARALPVLAAAALGAAYAHQVDRYWFLVDDAYISFRYAEHLVDGLGLVWNPGERVEGYTNFLWVLLVAAGLALGFAAEHTAAVLSVGSGVVLLGALVAFAARRHGWTDPWIWATPAVLVASRSFTAWCTGGLATMFFTCLTVGALLAFVVERERGRVPLGASALLVLATLTRPEGGLYMAVCGSAYLVELLRQPDRPALARLRELVTFCAPFVAVIGAHFLWRYAYYGFWLPNTFYVKVSGLWWEQAFRYLSLFHHDYGVGWVLPLALVPVVLRRGRTELLFAATLLVMTAYLVQVGGDIFEFRMLVPLLPLGYWLLVDAARRVAGAGRSPRAVVAWAAVVALVAWTRVASTETEAAPLRHGVASVKTMRAYTTKRLRNGRWLAELVDQGALPADVRIATSGAGALPYASGLYTVDVLGLNDVHIAHSELRGPRRGRPGHEKRATRGYLAEKEVALLDVAGGMVFPGRRPSPTTLATARRRTAKFNRTEGDAPLRLRCVRVPNGHLLFASPLDDRQLARVLGKLPSCLAPHAADAPRSRDERADVARRSPAYRATSAGQ